MNIGINYPWQNYGWDFGDPPAEWVPAASRSAWREESRQAITAKLAEIASLGITAVRWFILGDGTNYGLGPEAPRLHQGQWLFDPLPPEHPFYAQLREDFEFLLATCEANGLKLLPSLIDFQWAWPGETPPGSRTVIKCGRGQVLTDPHRREAFLTRVLDPLLELSYDYRDQIVAWELINEPEWVISQPWYVLWNRDPKRTISRGKMREFLTAGLRRINQYRGGVFRSTVGFAFARSVREWRSIGATLDQFHYYPAPGEPLPTGLESSIVGELATAANFQPWPELTEQTVLARIRLLESRGFPAAYLWSATDTGDPRDATSWTPDEQAQVAEYNRLRV